MHRKKRSRTFAVSFAVTLAALSGIYAYTYFSPSQQQTSSLPQSLPHYDSVWGKYAPADALAVTFENLTMLHSINSSLPPEKTLLQVVSPRILLNNSEIRSVVSVTYASPNASVDIAFVGGAAFERFSKLLAGSGQTPVEVGDSSLYEVRVNPPAVQLGWIAVIPRDGAIAFSVGTGEAKDAITQSLNVLYGESPSILSRTDMTQMVYIAGGAAGHLGIQIQGFPGVVRTGNMTLISVDAGSDGVSISYVVKFANAQTARGQYDAVKSAYLSSHQFTIYDNYVKASEYLPLSAVEAAIRLVG